MVDKKKKCKITRVRNLIQKQPAEVFFMKICSSDFRKIHRKIPVPESFLIKLQALGLRPGTLLTKRLWYRYFPVNFVKFLRTPFLQNPSARLLLLMVKRKTRVFVFAILVAKTMHDSSLAKRPFFSMHR